jgi:hypothetical protein
MINSKKFPRILKIDGKNVKAEVEISKDSITLWILEGKSRHWVFDFYKGELSLLTNLGEIWDIGFKKYSKGYYNLVNLKSSEAGNKFHKAILSHD